MDDGRAASALGGGRDGNLGRRGAFAAPKGWLSAAGDAITFLAF